MCITCTVRIMPHLFCGACHETHTPCDYGTVVLFVAKLGMHRKRLLLAVQRYCGQLEADNRVAPINCDSGSPFSSKVWGASRQLPITFPCSDEGASRLKGRRYRVKTAFPPSGKMVEKIKPVVGSSSV